MINFIFNFFLGIVYYFIITPLSLVMKLFYKSPLEIKTLSKFSFWKTKENKLNYNKQY